MSKFQDAIKSLTIPVDEPKRMTVFNPLTREPMKDKAGKEAFIELYSTESSVMRRHRNEMARRFAQSRSTLTPDQVEEQTSELLAVCTKDWYLVGPDGQPLNLEYNLANARELFAAPELVWLRQQADAFVGNLGNYSNWARE